MRGIWRNLHFWGVGFVFLIFIVTSVLFTTVIVSIPFAHRHGKTVERSQSVLYQVFSSNHVTRGFAKMNKELSDDQFISYSSSNGDQIIISNFASSQYKCEGTCLCSSKERRTSSNLLSHPLFLIISAVSSMLALRMAEKTFQNQCSLKFSSSCDEEDIESSVTSCDEKEEEEEGIIEYFCEGYCIPKRMRNPGSKLAQQEFFDETGGGCENLKTSGTIKMKRTIYEKGKQTLVLKGTGETKTYPNRFAHLCTIAQKKFSTDYLTSFCKKMSQREYWYDFPNKKQRQRKHTYMCSAGAIPTSLPDERLEYQYQNTKCTMKKRRK